MPSSSSSSSATPVSKPPYAAIALALSEQHWTQLGQGSHPMTAATDDFDVNVKRVTSLLLVRVVARIMEISKQTRQEELLKRQQEQEQKLQDSANELNEFEFDYKQQQQLMLLEDGVSSMMDETPFPETNWSTTNICSVFLQEQCDWPISDKVLKQVEQLVRNIMGKYDPNVPYHNASHATQVTISTNKLLDMLWVHRCNSFGLRQNAVSLLALVFSALIHDVEHKGLPNRQLAVENDDLAVLYNDNSIAEQRSLFVGFKELLSPDYKELREALFPQPQDYRDFRQKVVDLVMNTDIASPERTQLAKSKYVEAFGPMAPKPNAATAADEKTLTEDEVEDSMLEHVRKMPMNTVKILNKGVQNVSGSVMNVADAGVSGVKSVATMSVSGVKASMDGVTKMMKGVGGVVGVKSAAAVDQDTGNRSPKPPKGTVGSSMSRSIKRNDAATADSTPGESLDIIEQAKKYTVMPVKNTVKLMTGSLGSLGNSFGMNKNKRLGIRVSMDLTGETVETFRRTTRRNSLFKDEVDDEIDELKAAVLMDLMMTAADVSQNLQGYEQMSKWAGRLYNELRKAFLEERGVDPKPNWFQNQIGFLEFYLAPLSQRLDATGAYGPLGTMFGEVVEKNRDRWLVEGAKTTNKIIDDGFTKFPGNDEWLEYLVVMEGETAEASTAQASEGELSGSVEDLEKQVSKEPDHLFL